jgi:hypothetical protein
MEVNGVVNTLFIYGYDVHVFWPWTFCYKHRGRVVNLVDIAVINLVSYEAGNSSEKCALNWLL